GGGGSGIGGQDGGGQVRMLGDGGGPAFRGQVRLEAGRAQAGVGAAMQVGQQRVACGRDDGGVDRLVEGEIAFQVVGPAALGQGRGEAAARLALGGGGALGGQRGRLRLQGGDHLEGVLGRLARQVDDGGAAVGHDLHQPLGRQDAERL